MCLQMEYIKLALTAHVPKWLVLTMTNAVHVHLPRHIWPKDCEAFYRLPCFVNPYACVGLFFIYLFVLPNKELEM